MADYSTHDDTSAYAKSCNPATLDTEIRAGTFSAKVDGLVTHNSGVDEICVRTTSDLTAGEKTELDGIIAAHTP